MTPVFWIYGMCVAALTWVEFKRLPNWQICLKPFTACLFILIALLGGAIYWEFGRWIVMGLVACAVGDVLLLSRDKPYLFKWGMIAFGLGHVLYFIAFLQWDLLWPIIIVIGIAMAGVSTRVYSDIKDGVPADMKMPIMAYMGIIILMVGTALATKQPLIGTAAVMFAISDIFVAKDRFIVAGAGQYSWHALAITPLYFGAQALFAYSAAF